MTPTRVAVSITSTRSDLTPPSTPTDLSGTPVAGGRIDLSWTAATDNVAVAGYNVYRDSTKVNTAPIGSTSYSDTGLVGGANHTYTVKAVDAAANESSASNTWSGAASSGAVTTTYSYDAENRLTKLQSGSNVIGSYAYDGAGNRYSKTAAGVTTAYTLDLASGLPQVLSETAGSAVTSYAYASGPLELDRSGATNWYLTDTLGSVRLVTDSTGATPVTYAYSAFGSTRTSTGSLANEVRFSGERTDTESGLQFLRARTYDPSVGTFLQRDSWGISPTDGQSIDAYVYTANNPVNAVDPSGHLSCRYGRETCSEIAQAKKAATSRGGFGGLWGTPPTTAKKAEPAPQGRPDCHGDWLCSINNAVGTAGDLGRQAGGGLGNLHSQFVGNTVINAPADFLHDRGFSFSATVGICADLFPIGGGIPPPGGWGGQFGGGICAEATTNGQLGIVGYPGAGVGPGNSGLRAGGDINLLISNGADIADQRGPFVGAGGAVSRGLWGGDLNGMGGPNHCTDWTGSGGITTNVTGGWAPGFGSKAGPQTSGSLTTIIWQSKPSAPCQ